MCRRVSQAVTENPLCMGKMGPLMSLGNSLARLVSGLETYYIDKYSIPSYKQHSYRGRGQPAKLASRPVLPPRPRSRPCLDRTASDFASLATRLRELAMVKRGTVDLDMVATHVQVLTTHLRRLKSPDPEPDGKLEHNIEIDILHSSLAKLESATVQDCLVLHHQAQQLANSQMRKARRCSYTKIRNRLAESLADGAKAAHQWTNEANQLLPIKIPFLGKVGRLLPTPPKQWIRD